MLDTMTFTKIVGSFCGALLVFLLGKWAAEGLYHTPDGYGEERVMGYAIETGEDDAAAEEEAEPELSMEEVLASGDAGAGERVWSKCRACHQLNGSNAVGPYLNGVVGREIGLVDAFNYSGSLSEQADVWSQEHLYNFLENPRDWAPGTTMSFAGLDDPQDRANVIAYLESTAAQ